MEDFERLRLKVTRLHCVLLVAGSALSFLLFTESTAFAFALGTALGILNFRLHTHAIRILVQSGTEEGEQQRGTIVRGVLAFALRWGIVVAVLGITYIFYDLQLLPAAVGLLGTYAVLICVGIMSSYGGSHEAPQDS